MPRFILPSVLLLLSPSASWAQFDTVDVAWERPLTSPSYGAFHPIEVEAAPDGGVLVVGLARELPLTNLDLRADVVLTKLNENGDVEWTDAIDSPSPQGSFVARRYADAVFDEEGNAFVVVSRKNASVLRRYNADGTIAWEEILPTRSIPGTSGWIDYNASWVGLQPSGDVVVSGPVCNAAYPRVDVRAFGSDGTPRWEWRGDGGSGFQSSAMVFPLGMEIGPGGRVHVYGQFDNLTSFRVGQIITLDPGGQPLWRLALPSNAGVRAIAFDSQGDIVALTPYFDLANSAGPVLDRVSADGALISTAGYFEPGFQLGSTSLALDAFDRIFVGGSRRQDAFGARDATLFRFDPAGAFLGSDVPSVQGVAQDGSFEALHVTSRGDIVAFGSSRTGIDEIILARFAPDGTERWSRRRRGQPPTTSGSPSVGLGLAADPRGNLFTLAETSEGGTFPFQMLGLDLVKHVQNGPASSSYCGPAVPNSTGLPASIRALGPRLVTADNVTLRADDLPPGALTLLLASRTQGSVVTVGGGQGTLCLGGSIGRFFGPGQVRVADPTGSAALQLDLTQLPQPNGSVAGMAGESWNFQGWYRDANPGSTSNLTDGIEVTLQ